MRTLLLSRRERAQQAAFEAFAQRRLERLRSLHLYSQQLKRLAGEAEALELARQAQETAAEPTDAESTAAAEKEGQPHLELVPEETD